MEPMFAEMYTQEQFYCRAEAKRYCAEHEISDPDECLRVEASITHQAFRRAIEPITKQIARLYGFRYLKRIRLGATPEETEYEWLVPDAPKVIAQLQELIQLEAKKYGLRLSESAGTDNGEGRE